MGQLLGYREASSSYTPRRSREQGVIEFGPRRRCDSCRLDGQPGSCRRCPLACIDRRELETSASGRARKTAIYVEKSIRLEAELGRGGMGTVFSGVDETLDRVVAIKFLLPELQSDPAMVERFRREARATASISHQNVIRLFSRGQYGGSDYFVAEYVDGFSLEELLARARREGELLPIDCVLVVFDQLCEGLQAVHAAGVVHRDVKPGNVMIEAETGRVVIMDFGLGPAPEAGAGARPIGGTPAYMAPEVISGKALEASLGHRPDVYSLGATLYEALTGRPPFVSSSWVDVLHQHLTERPPPPSSLRPELPPALDDVVLRCLEKDPRDRFASCAELQEALRGLRRERTSLASGDADQATILEALSAVERSRAVEMLEHVITVSIAPENIVVFQEGLRRLVPSGIVHGARTVAKGLDLVRRFSARVMIAPLDVGEVNGLELAALLKPLGGARLVVTAVAITERERRQLDRGGIAAVVLEPIGPAEAKQALLHAALSSW